MATCDICDKEIDSGSEVIVLYSAKIVGQSASKDAPVRKVVTRYEDFQPVRVTVCNRHKRDLFIQRLIVGVLCFLILFFPVMTIVYLLFKALGILSIVTYIVAVAFDLVNTIFLCRLIRYDAFVAKSMGVRDRERGLSSKEYFTKSKYERLLGKKKSHI